MSQTFSFDLRFAKRFVRILLVANGHVRTLSVIVYLLFLTVLYETAGYNVGMITGTYYKALGDRDQQEFWTQTAKALVLIAIIALLKSCKEYIASSVYLEWRRSLTDCLIGHYFRGQRYYTLNVLANDGRHHSKDNLDQRLTQDIDLFCRQLSLIVADVIVWPFLIGFYTYRSFVVIGYIGPVGCLIFFAVSTIINKGLISMVLHYVYLQQQAEGDYRFQHMRVRTQAESIAVQRGAHYELTHTRRLFNRLLAIQERLILRELGLKTSVYLFDYLGSIVSFMVLSVPVFGGRYDDMLPSDLALLISQTSFVTIYLINCFTRIIDMATSFTTIGGTAHRIGQVFEWLDVGSNGRDNDDSLTDSVGHEERSGYESIHSEHHNYVSTISDNDNYWPSPVRRPLSDHKMYCQFKNVTIKVPNSDRVLINRLTFVVDSETRLLIAGESGTCKTSILRVLRGLWPATIGTVDRCIPFDEQKVVLFLPQKPLLLTTGSLFEQISYPLTPRLIGSQMDDQTSELITHYMNLLDLSSILDRVGHEITRRVDWNWTDALSPGEQQRLCFVRLFYHRPVLAILDESTSAVSLRMERIIYEELQRLDIAYVSCGHRQSLREYHRQVLGLTETHNPLDSAINQYTIESLN